MGIIMRQVIVFIFFVIVHFSKLYAQSQNPLLKEQYRKEAFRKALKEHYDEKATPQIVDRIVAIYGQQFITARELEEKAALELKDVLSILDPKEREQKKQAVLKLVLDRLIGESLIDAELAKMRDKIGVTEAAVEKSFEEIAKANNVDVATLIEWLKRNGKTVEQQKKEIRREMEAAQILQLRMQGKNSLNEKDVAQKCREVELFNKSEVSVLLRHILVEVTPQATPEQVEKAKEKIQMAYQSLLKNREFSEVMSQYSEDKTTKDGDLGYYQRGNIPEIDAVIFKLKIGDYTLPIRTNLGFHIFRLEDKKQGNNQPGCEDPQVKNRVMVELNGQLLERQKSLWIEELKNKAYIEIKL